MTKIVYVDDKMDDLLDHAGSAKGLFDSYYPEQHKEAFEAAKLADLWLFDFYLDDLLDDETALTKDNGLSTFHKWRRFTKEERPPTVLVSSYLEHALGGEPGPAKREDVLAQRVGVEWVGKKDLEEVGRTIANLVEIQRASTAISARATESNNGEIELICFGILGAPAGSQWKKAAERQVDRARPPKLSDVDSGRAKARLMIAWLLHKVLPYPSFLLNDRHVAIRLGLTLESLRRVVGGKVETELGEMIAAAEYTGPLSNMLGRRWWRAGIDHIVWGLSQDNSGYLASLARLGGKAKVHFLDIEDPVVVSDADLLETDEIASASDCLRARDEYFPPDVPEAWIKPEDAAGGEFVIFDDRPDSETDSRK